MHCRAGAAVSPYRGAKVSRAGSVVPAHGQEDRGARTGVSREDEQEINIQASAEAIWRALTDADELKRWLVESAHVEPTVGGVYRLVFGDGLETDFRIATWQPGERLRLVSQMPTSAAEPVVEEYILEKSGSNIILRVVTSGI